MSPSNIKLTCLFDFSCCVLEGSYYCQSFWNWDPVYSSILRRQLKLLLNDSKMKYVMRTFWPNQFSTIMVLLFYLLIQHNHLMTNSLQKSTIHFIQIEEIVLAFMDPWLNLSHSKAYKITKHPHLAKLNRFMQWLVSITRSGRIDFPLLPSNIEWAVSFMKSFRNSFWLAYNVWMNCFTC